MTKAMNSGQNKDESWKIRGEDGEGGRSPISSSKGGVASDGEQVQGFAKRIYGETWARGVLSTTVVGGILSLEKKRAEEALKNAQECIEWYSREKQRALEWIAQVEALQAEVNLDLGADDAQS